jgi:hypothetical protein
MVKLFSFISSAIYLKLGARRLIENYYTKDNDRKKLAKIIISTF